MALDFAELQRRKRPATAECVIALDSGVINAHAMALRAYEVAKTVATDNPDQASARAALADASEALDEAEAAADEASVTFRFRGLSAEEWDALIDLHAATPDQIKKARKDDPKATLLWNDDTFPQALVAACSIEPDLTVEEANEMWKSDNWNAAELQGLFLAAREASRTRRVPELGKGSRPT